MPGYLLPWPGGLAFTCIQGNGGAYSHQGLEAYAWDFAMSTGSVVTAARAGVVRFVRDDADQGGSLVAVFGDDGNYVVVDHGDGTSALYLHLMYHGALVRVGEEVARGQPLAYSGATGFAAGPHLHVMVERSDPGNWYTQSLPARFADVPGDGVPVAGGAYVSGNARVAFQRAARVIPLASPPPVAVPALVGLTVAQAEAALRPWGLTLALDPPQPSTAQQAGRLAAQEPAAGAAAAIGTIVHASPSDGPPTPTPTATATPTPTATVTASPGANAPPATAVPAPGRAGPTAAPARPGAAGTAGPAAPGRAPTGR